MRLLHLRRVIRLLMKALPLRWRLALASARNRSRPTLGRGAFVHPSVQMLGKSAIRLGENSVLSQDCWLNVNHRDAAGFAIDIGDHCLIGRRNFFSSGAMIRLGAYVLTTNDCQFIGSTHVADNPLQPWIMTGTTATDTITVGTNTFIGAGARILGNVTIGHGCVIGAGAMVMCDAPPFSQMHGSPARVHRRYSFLRQAWVPTADFTEADAEALPTEQDYLLGLRRQPRPQMPYIVAGSDMGNC